MTIIHLTSIKVLTQYILLKVKGERQFNEPVKNKRVTVRCQILLKQEESA